MRSVVALLLLVGCGPDERTSLPLTGYVELRTWEYLDDMPYRRGQTFTRFLTSADTERYVDSIGPCELFQHDRDDYVGELVNAGPISVEGAKQPITLVPDAHNYYSEVNTSTSTFFDGGENLFFIAGGGQVPAFRHETKAPAKALVTSPTQPVGFDEQWEVLVAEDLLVTWSGGGNELLEVTLTGGEDYELVCRLPAAPGAGTIPSAALAVFANAGVGQFRIVTASHTELDVGAWRVKLRAEFDAMWSLNEGPVSGYARYR